METFIKGETNVFSVKSLTYDKNTQEYTLCKNMPLISRINMKEMKIFNNEMFICKEIKENTIIVKNELKTLEIPKSQFHKIFLMSFCITTHKSQGLS
jgi:hypothetical protein